MNKTFSAYWQFLKKPQLLKVSDDKKVLERDFLWLLLLDLSIASVLTLIFWVLTKFKLINEYKEADIIKDYGIYLASFLVCIIAPLTEEILFRWYLTKRYASNYFVFFAISGIIISYIKNEYIGFSVFLLFLLIAIYSHNRLKRLSQTNKQNLWRTCFPFIFYFSALIFGLIHLSNYEGLTVKDPTFILYISSQIVGGLSLGYIRIKHGLKYSIFYHAAFNMIGFSLAIIFDQ